MTANLKRAALAAAAIAVVMSVAAPADARKPVAPPPPAFGYYYGSFPVELDYAQAQAWSLKRPYYTHFLYDYCDYRNCVLKLNPSTQQWEPAWYGPVD